MCKADYHKASESVLPEGPSTARAIGPLVGCWASSQALAVCLWHPSGAPPSEAVGKPYSSPEATDLESLIYTVRHFPTSAEENAAHVAFVTKGRRQCKGDTG